ncbi:hypothetical protein Tco_0044809 [Tanacetum coccineum]
MKGSFWIHGLGKNLNSINKVVIVAHAMFHMRWIEKMESVMDISGCVNNQKVKYVASSLINKALTWWNTQIQARGRDVALGIIWEDFKALLVEDLCPCNEMEKLESEF